MSIVFYVVVSLIVNVTHLHWYRVSSLIIEFVMFSDLVERFKHVIMIEHWH